MEDNHSRFLVYPWVPADPGQAHSVPAVPMSDPVRSKPELMASTHTIYIFGLVAAGWNQCFTPTVSASCSRQH